MIYGKISGTFELLTEETAIKWKIPIGTTAVSDTFPAGVAVDATGGLALDTSYAAGTPSCILFDSYGASTYPNDAQGSGFVTGIFGRHIGRTNQVGAMTVTDFGTALYLASGGKLSNSSNGTQVAILLSWDGTFATYYWIGN